MLKLVEGNSPYGARLITDTPLRKGEVFFRFEHYRIVPEATYQTIQIGVSTHIEELGVLAYLNHSCKPTAVVHAGELACFAARDLAAGEELNYFYPSTEWNMARPFICLCGAPECVRMVTGARHVPIDLLARYYINEHIRTLIATELDTAARAHQVVEPAPAR